MRQIQLTGIILENFKGVQHGIYEFANQSTIEGGNATGKSTIYEAYLWCLFNKNSYGNETKVQPLDENNQVKHNLVTRVTCLFKIDGQEMRVARELEEDWAKQRGSAEMVLKGTTSAYFVNGVPMKLGEFNAKLSEFLDLDKWFMLSSINILPTMDQKTRRAWLQDIAPTFDEKALAAQYPAVLDALEKGTTADQLLTITKNHKTELKSKLDEIPGRIDQQEKLRVDKDFAAAEKEMQEVLNAIESTNKEIEAIKHPNDADGFFTAQAEAQRAELAKLNDLIVSIETKTRIRAGEDNYDAEKEVSDISHAIEEKKRRVGMINYDLELENRKIDDLEKQKISLREDWARENAKTMPETSDKCPTCGQELPEEMKAKIANEWNEAKTKRLKEIVNRAQPVKEQLDEIKAKLQANQQEHETLDKEIDDLQTKLAAAQAKRSVVQTYESRLANNKEYQEYLVRRASIQQSIETAANNQQQEFAEKLQPLNQELERLNSRKRELQEVMAEKNTNERIDTLRAELEKQQQDLAQSLANEEAIEKQVAEFKKRKIALVEEGVSSLFQIVRWKMYEPNLTNDGEKEICQAIIDGVPYEQQNRAMQVNAAVDMIRAFSKAYEVALPLFVDNSESVEHIMDAETQTITLQVVPGAKLNIINH